MMKIILLSGKPNTGKTVSLRDELYGRFESLNARVITDKDDDDTDGPVDYVVEYNGKTVAVRVDGDLYYQCMDAIVRYAACDFLVLAYSDKFSRSLAKLVKKYAPQCGHMVIRKKAACDSDNTRVCDEIINALR